MASIETERAPSISDVRCFSQPEFTSGSASVVVLQHAASETPAAVPITVRAGVKVVCFHDPLHCAAGRRFQADLFFLTHYAGVTPAGL